jgi:hypothetical protein
VETENNMNLCINTNNISSNTGNTSGSLVCETGLGFSIRDKNDNYIKLSDNQIKTI